MSALARRTAVVCTTVGPYARYGTPLVAACAANGTDYCDLAGEVTWIRRMQDVHGRAAEESGARIVNACGFDSIPSDLGVYFLQQEMRRRHGAPSPAVKGVVGRISAGLSGGTVASMLALFEADRGEGPLSRVTGDPYLLNPEGARDGPAVRDQFVPHYDDDFEAWTAPFAGAMVNTRVVRRSATQLGDMYGERMRYQESMSMGPGPIGALKATGLTLGLGAAPDVPSAAPMRTRVYDDRDPGYGSASKMVAESAVCLALDPRRAAGGFHTPAAAMGAALLERLQQNAGIGFEVSR
jgi:short subunit dehydrogenase-like uncharacterized protein